MPKQPKRYYLYARKRADQGPVWYVRFRDEHGAIGSPLCTEETDKGKAEQWAVERLLDGFQISARKPKAKTFEEWASPWWHFETCPYITAKMADGYHISKAYAVARRSYLDGYLVPEFGKIPVSQISSTMLQDYKLRLFREGRLKPGSINRIIGTLRIMFRYAVEMHELAFDPMKPVKELAEHDRMRGILSLEELAALFGPDSFEKVWNKEPRHYAINLLAASAGLRLGECQALQVKAIDSRGYIDVARSWDDRYGMGQPKWNSRRFVPVPAKTAEAINALLALKRWGDPQPDDVVFWGQDRDTPITKTAVLKQFKAALVRIGVKEEQREHRNLVFHSYRHGFQTMIRGRVPDEQLRRVTGHKSLAMQDHYDHPQPEHLADVKAVQETLFSLPKASWAK